MLVIEMIFMVWGMAFNWPDFRDHINGGRINFRIYLLEVTLNPFIFSAEKRVLARLETVGGRHHKVDIF
jgi:hypothetical protein